MKRIPFVFNLFCLAAAALSSRGARADGFHIDAEAKTESYLSVQQHSKPDIQVNQSHIELRLENEDFKRILSTFHIPQENVTAITSFSLRFSGVPYFVGDYTKGKLADQVDSQLNAFRASQQPGIAQQVSQAINSNPETANLPAPVKQMLQKEFVAHANQQLDAKLAQVREEKIKQVNSRLSDVEFETAIQEIAISVGGVVGDGTALIFLRAGKFRVDVGPQTDVDGNSELDNVRHVPNRIQRNAGTMGTGAVDLGVIKNFSPDVHLRADVYFFHHRIPYITGNEVLANALTMSDAEYRDHKEWWKIDSEAFRALLDTKQMQIYVGAANLDGRGAVVAGTILKITENDRVYVDVTDSNRGTGAVRQGVSIFYVHQLTEFISAHTGLTYVHKSEEPLLSALPLTYLEPTLGVSWDVVHKEIWGWDVKAGVGTELFYRDYQGKDQPKSGFGERFGGYLQAQPVENNAVKRPLF